MNGSMVNCRAISSFFTRPAFAGLAKSGDCHQLFAPFLKSGVIIRTESKQPLGSIFDAAWDFLSHSYRNEYVYKNDLACRIIFGRHSPKTAGFQIELPVGRSIVDVAVANGTSTAYEIKTEFDTLKRLGSQTSDYLKAFDKVFVVTHPSHLSRFEQEIDERVGIILMSTSGRMKTVRDALSNKTSIDSKTVFRCLRRAEYLEAISGLFGIIPNLPNGLIGDYCEKLFLQASPLQAHEVFVSALKKRSTHASNVKFIQSLPLSLRALGYATPLSDRQKTTLTNLFTTPVGYSLAF